MRATWLRSAATAALLIAGTALGSASVRADGTHLLRMPTVSKDKLAFIYAGDLWVANRDGSDPRRLTSSPVDEREPMFSPDGKMIAYTANFENNDDVYVISVDGGQPKRLTYHSAGDDVTGWSHDGKAVAFSSTREVGFGRTGHLYHVSLEGGLPEKQMEAPVFRGAWSADGGKLAFMAFGPAYNALYGGATGWRGYRGGRVPSIDILTPGTKSVTRVPGKRVNDIDPMWVGDAVYFLSDRDEKVFNVFRFDPKSGAVKKITQEGVWDVRAADAHGDTLVYEAGGELKSVDLTTGAVSGLTISVNPDLPQLRPGWKDASGTIQSAALSPTGKRAVLVGRGDVFTVPLDKGSTRNLTGTDGVREATALWSPKGGEIAYLSDEGNVHSLKIVDQTGKGDARSFDLGPDYYTLLEWAGQGQHILYQNNHLTLFALDVDSGKITTVATAERRSGFSPVMSPDGRWIAYVQVRENFYNDLMLYHVENGTAHRISDGMGDVGSPAFSRDGAYLYFTASTNSGPAAVGLDMSSQERPYRAGLYAVVLAEDGTSPLLPETGDEEVDEDEAGSDGDGADEADIAMIPPRLAEEEDGESEEDTDETEDEAEGEGESEAAGADEDEADKPTQIDLDGIENRIVALPVEEGNYDTLAVAKDGSLFYIQRVQPGTSRTPPGQSPASGNRLMRFDFEDLETSSVTRGVVGMSMSHDGSHIMVRKTGNRLMAGKAGKSLDLKRIKTSDMRVYVDPRKEWLQIFNETWRMEKDFFYAANMHGLDWQAVYDRYRPLLDHVGRREDLTALLREMIGEMQVGHNYMGGGDVHQPDRVSVGLLGADLRVENDRYRIAKIYTGELWNPFLKAPLAAPGIGVSEGDYILAVNGRSVTGADNIFALMAGTVGEQVTLTVGKAADGNDSEDVVVEPVANERALRLWHWIEENRRYVDEKTGGKVGYVYLPNTGGAGYRFFNRMFFPQTDREGMILDERSNGGGQAANYITDVLSRTYLASWKDRDGLLFNTPGGAMYGPKVMLIDQDAGSGGDFLPYSFRYMKLGKLIGTRTWGGLIGISINPPLIDGGFLTVPFFRFIRPDGRWTIENEGVEPDIEVFLDPVALNEGRDTQLDKAIGEVMKQLESYKPKDLQEAPPLPTKLGQ